MLRTIKTWVVNSALNRRPITEWPLAWVYAPKPGDIEFALRNTIAALFALAVAFWWELGEPQWAAMTVWIVAQGSRGESLSKGRWRLVGTILGMVSAISLVAVFPQQPWLFLPVLALWAGLCTGLATLVHNFRSYAFVLAAYTCAIIAMDASAAPHHVFQIAMARGTYIFLGVICEMVAGMVFSQDLPRQAREIMRARLLDAITSATTAVYDIVREEPPPESDVRAVYGQTLTLHDQIEFSAVEIGRNEHSVQYAYATTGILSRIMSRALGLKARLAAVPNRTRTSQTILIRTTEFLSALPQRLALAEDVPEARDQLDELIAQCVHAIGVTLENENAAGEDEAARTLAINDRIALQGLRLILGEYHMLLTFFHGDEQRKLRPAHYRLRHLPNWRAAFHNGVRTSAAIVLAALIWEVTAWPSGAGFVSFIAVVCGRFGTFENTVLVSNQFFYGACVAVLVSIIPVFLMIPVASSYGALALALAPAMFLSGLALRNPGTALPAASFATFFPAILGLDNQHRMDEITWFNSSMALLAGLGGGVLVFRCVLPFDEKRVCRIMRLRVLTGLSDIGRGVRRSLDDNRWIGITTQSMQRLIRYAGRNVPPLVDTYLHGTLAVMTMGRNLIHLRRINAEPTMPDDARTALEDMFSRMATHRLTVEELRAVVGDALEKLRRMEADQNNAASRLALTDAIGSLLIVSTEVNGNELFFDDRKFDMAMLLPSIATA